MSAEDDAVMPALPDPEDAAAAAAEALRRATRSTAPRRTTSSTRGRVSGGSRDPQTVGQAVDDLLAERGWQQESAVASLMSRWEQIVGPDLAAHVAPVSFQEGVLTLQAESTAWATQTRLLQNDLRRAIDQDLGGGVVTDLTVLGPTAPSWVKGPRHVKGRGPRDTYG